MRRFATEREQFTFYMNNLPELDARLAEGARKAQEYGARSAEPKCAQKWAIRAAN